MRDPDQAQQLLDSSRGNLAPDALERAELSLNVGRAERTRKERETKLNTDRQASLLFGNRRDTLLGIAETGMDDGSMEKRFTELGREDLATSWRKERNAAVKLHSFFRETDGTPLLEQARQLGKKFKSGVSDDAPEGSMDFALSALRKRTEAFTKDPVGQMAARVQEALGPQANSAEALRMNQRLQRETAKGLPGFRPRVMARDNARQYRELYEEQSGQGRMDVLRGLEPLPVPYRRQALAEAVPGVMPQLAHLALENGRSSKGDMNLWLEAHRPKTGKLEGDPAIEREALANLETSDVFRAVTAPLRLGGGRQGELMLDEFRRGAARYGMLRNDPMAGVRFLEENVRTLQSEGLAEIYWSADKTMPADLEVRLRDARGEIINMYQDKPGQGGMVNLYQDKPSQGGMIDDLVMYESDKLPGAGPKTMDHVDPVVENRGKYVEQSIWVNSDDGRGFVLMGPDGEMVTDTRDNPIVLTPRRLERWEFSGLEPGMHYLSSDSGGDGGGSDRPSTGDGANDGISPTPGKGDGGDSAPTDPQVVDSPSTDEGGSEDPSQPSTDGSQTEPDAENEDDSVGGLCGDPKTDYARDLCDIVLGTAKEGAFEGVENLPPDNILRQMQESWPEEDGTVSPDDFPKEGFIEKAAKAIFRPVTGAIYRWNPALDPKNEIRHGGGGGPRSELPSPPSHASSEEPDSKA